MSVAEGRFKQADDGRPVMSRAVAAEIEPLLVANQALIVKTV